MTRPLMLDLFCGAGGAAVGYHRAGFDVVGVDIAPQSNYPFEFIQMDALLYVCKSRYRFDAIHASPPCQGYLAGALKQNYPRLITATRRAIQTAAPKTPYVIENVAAARSEMIDPIMLCGTMFNGLKVYRHRLFETSFSLSAPPHLPHIERFPRAGRGANENGWICVCGNMKDPNAGRAAMGIDWTNRRELAESIPPAYTEHIGRQLLKVLSEKEVTA